MKRVVTASESFEKKALTVGKCSVFVGRSLVSRSKVSTFQRYFPRSVSGLVSTNGVQSARGLNTNEKNRVSAKLHSISTLRAKKPTR